MVLLGLSLVATGCGGGGFGEEATGTSGGGPSNSPVVGTWRAELLIPVGSDDYVQETTTWAFGSDDSCRRVIVSLQYSEGVAYTTLRTCTYRLNQGVVIVLYDDAMTEVPYPFSKPLNDPDVLVLSGITYGRIP